MWASKGLTGFGGDKGIQCISGAGTILEALTEEGNGSSLELAEQRLEVLIVSKLQYLH